MTNLGCLQGREGITINEHLVTPTWANLNCFLSVFAEEDPKNFQTVTVALCSLEVISWWNLTEMLNGLYISSPKRTLSKNKSRTELYKVMCSSHLFGNLFEMLSKSFHILLLTWFILQSFRQIKMSNLSRILF